jgi:hypothetical protein
MPRDMEKLRAYRRENKDRWRGTARAYQRKWYKENPHRTASYSLKHNYGITLEQKSKMRTDQGGLCKLCSLPLPEELSKCFTEHNHETKVIRGLVHPACNMLIGLIETNKEKMESAILNIKSYLGLESHGH